MLSFTYPLQTAVITPALQLIDCANPCLANVLTALGMTPKEVDDDCYGLYAMSHEQHWALWDTYLVHYPALASTVRGMASQHEFLKDPDRELNTNLAYATAIAALWLQMHAQTTFQDLSSSELMLLWNRQANSHCKIDYRQLSGIYQHLAQIGPENVA